MANDVRINRWLDFADRVGWTAVQAAGAATITVLATDANWKEGLLFVGIAVLLAVAKVAVAQQVGKDQMGDLVLGSKSVIETVPADERMERLYARKKTT